MFTIFSYFKIMEYIIFTKQFLEIRYKYNIYWILTNAQRKVIFDWLNPSACIWIFAGIADIRRVNKWWMLKNQTIPEYHKNTHQLFENIIWHISRGIADGKSGRVWKYEWCFADPECIPHGCPSSMTEIDQHSKPVHFAHNGFAKASESTAWKIH